MRRATELQIQIDDVYACLGQCPGCILSSAERKVAEPDMTPTILDLATDRLIEYAASLAPLKRVNLTYGIADHLLMDEAYVADLHARGAAVIRAGQPADLAHSAVFFTTSLIGKADQIIPRLERLRTATDIDVPLLPLVVLDPRLMRAVKFGPLWREMVLAARRLFGKVDLSINLSDEAVSLMGPGELVGFAETNGFDEVTVNWTPTLLNAPRTLANLPATRAWLVAFDEILRSRPDLGTSFRPVIMRTVDSVMCRADGEEPSARKIVEEIVPETMAKSIEIDSAGNLLPKFEAVGDVAHSDRFGLVALGHLSEGPIAEILERATPKVLRRILSTHARGACATCSVSGICAGTGFHVTTHVMREARHAETQTECPHVARVLIERIRDEMLAAGAGRDAA